MQDIVIAVSILFGVLVAGLMTCGWSIWWPEGVRESLVLGAILVTGATAALAGCGVWVALRRWVQDREVT